MIDAAELDRRLGRTAAERLVAAVREVPIEVVRDRIEAARRSVPAPVVEVVTEEQLRAREAALLASWPVLATIDPVDLTGCGCPGCVTSAVGQRYGWDVADAWDDLADARFLLGVTS